MSTRRQFIQKILEQIYSGKPTDDREISDELVNMWVIEGTAIAAKQNYKEAIQVDGIGWINNSFYTTFKGITISDDGNFTYKFILPQIPIGIGKDEGIGTITFLDENGNLSNPAIPISENQWGYYQSMRKIPNKILYKSEGIFGYAMSVLPLWRYTVSVTMISGGNSLDLDSVLNVPDDFLPIISEYVAKNLMAQRMAPKDVNNDGVDTK